MRVQSSLITFGLSKHLVISGTMPVVAEVKTPQDTRAYWHAYFESGEAFFSLAAEKLKTLKGNPKKLHDALNGMVRNQETKHLFLRFQDTQSNYINFSKLPRLEMFLRAARHACNGQVTPLLLSVTALLNFINPPPNIKQVGLAPKLQIKKLIEYLQQSFTEAQTVFHQYGRQFQELDQGKPLLHPIKKVLEMHEPTRAHKNITLERVDLSHFKAADYQLSAMEIFVIFENLYANALKYTPPGGRVSLILGPEQTEATSKLVWLSVKDSGMGIAKRNFTSLGKEGYRATNARKAKIPGTGTGLSLVKSILEKQKQGLSWQIESPAQWGTEQKGTLISVPLLLKK